jgi:hypothetical protein
VDGRWCGKLRLDGELLWDLHRRCGGGRSELATVIAKGKNMGGVAQLISGENEGGWVATDKRSLP